MLKESKNKKKEKATESLPDIPPKLLIDENSRKAYLEGEKIHLSPSEFNILNYFNKNRGRLVTHQEIVNAIDRSNSNTSSVRVLINRIRKRLKVNQGFTDPFKTVWGKGYIYGKIFSPPSPDSE